MTKHHNPLMPIVVFLSLLNATAFAQPSDSFQIKFMDPPHESRPRTWWHWVGGNVTKDGITKDLEWMKRAGIGGFHAFDVSLGMGQTTEKKIIFMTPEWLDAIRHTAAEAGRLGLEMTMVTSAGWSETGGPWVKPEEAMKKVVWSETRISGGKKFIGKLKAPPSTNGPIQNFTRPAGFGISRDAPPDPTYYADQFVVAYPTPPEEMELAQQRPVITSSEGNMDFNALMDDDLQSKVTLPLPNKDKPVWIRFEYPMGYTARAFSLAFGLTGSFGSKDMCTGFVEYSDDGRNYHTLLSLPGPQHDIRAIPVRTYAFAETTAKFFRIVLLPGTGISTVGSFGSPGFFGPAPTTFALLEAVFHHGARVNRWEDKAHFAPMFDLETLPTPDVSARASIPVNAVIDLTSRLSADGTLTWDTPKGNWTILRIGYSLTGSKNGPAMPAGVGFEVDKLSKTHLESYYKQYTAEIKKTLGPLFGKTLQYWLTDSFEADAQNWTEDMPAEFKRRRSYELISYLPVLTGKIVGNAQISDRFLWDFRKTIAELLADNHYGALAELARNDGMKLYGESAGISLPFMQDALLNKKHLDIPMGEFGMSQGLGAGETWTSPQDLEYDHAYRGAADRMNAHYSDIREAASAAHIYGKKIVAAESWTGGGFESPLSLKRIGDYWNTQGVNRFIFHTSTHQPLDTKPGNAMVGMHMHRNITWAEQAKPFTDYLSRNSYLLQQGEFVADIAYYLGESIPAAAPYWRKLSPEIPAGYDYDFINTDALQSMEVKDGQLTLPSGMQYSVLVLHPSHRMTLPVLQKIEALLREGAIVVGYKPVGSQGLAGYPESDTTVRLLANQIWADADGQLVFQHDYGKGRVYCGVPLHSVLADRQISPDFRYTRPHINTSISWIHRRTASADIYFLANLRKQSESIKATFRVSGKKPSLWYSDTGSIRPVTYGSNNRETEVAVTLEAEGSVFVVFESSAPSNEERVKEPTTTLLNSVAGPWQLAFPKNFGAPEKITLGHLISWTDHANNGVKYFSGTCTYQNSITAAKRWFETATPILLDLGEVKDIAEVIINGKQVGTLWKRPYVIDITSALKIGQNILEVKVTNQWSNRIAGDAANLDTKVLSGAGFSFGPPSTVLKPSGLIGPVRVLKQH